MKRKLVVLLAAIILILCTLPTAAFAIPGYHSNDMTKMKTFLNLPSAISGKTNGQCLNAAYDPNIPSTWTGVIWNAAFPMRIISIDMDASSLAGSLDISGFTDLTFLSCYENQLTSLDASGDAALASIFCFSNQLTSVNVSGCTSLTRLDCSTNKLTSLDMTGCPAMDYLTCSYNDLTTLDVTACSAIRYLYCSENDLTSLNISGCSLLIDIFCDHNQLSAIDASGLTHLTRFLCNVNQLTVLNVTGCTGLSMLYCSDNQLTSLGIAGLSSLKDLACGQNQITALDTSGCAALETVSVSVNQLASLDLTASTKLTAIDCLGNPMTQLHVLVSGSDIRLGVVGGGFVQLLYAPSVKYILAYPGPDQHFSLWTEAGSDAAAPTQYLLEPETDYNLVAHFVPPLTTATSPANGVIYTGGRYTVTPNLQGGTWQYPQDLLSADLSKPEAVFTALKPGSATIIYTLGDQSSWLSVMILEAELPATGQNFTPVLWLLALAVCMGAATLITLCRKRYRPRA